ncbi:MAG: cbb3-type cytochrome c oxidase N-terminal domain-containing protein [Ferruginibacter sp.]
MMFIRSIKNKITLTALALIACTAIAAQTTDPVATKTESTGYNQLAILLMIMIIVLAFVIWGMGQVLTALGKQLVDKNKNASKLMTVVLFAGFSLLSQVSFAQDASATKVIQEIPNYGGLSQSAYYMFLTVIGMEVVVILFLAFSIRRMYTELLPEKVRSVSERSNLAVWWTGLDKKLFTKAVAVEKEADIMLDHNYDGIRELDNALPPWWKYGFYITIVIAFIYLLNFHVLGLGKNPTEEYNIEMENARIEKEIYDANNKDKVDENNVPMADASGIQAGQQMFEANCVACHVKGAGGSQNPVSVGPNLTDDYWLHKGSLNDIYNTIKNGYLDKGMQSWSSKFNPKEISQLASYIKSLKGTNPPNAKLPQGEIYTESVKVPAGDSTGIAKPDSASSVKKDSVISTKKL